MSSWSLPQSISIPLPRSTTLSLLLGVFIGISVSLSSSSLTLYLLRKREERYNIEYLGDRVQRPIELRSDEVLRDGVVGLIGELCLYGIHTPQTIVVIRLGNTPLIRINSLSNALGVEILVSHCPHVLRNHIRCRKCKGKAEV